MRESPSALNERISIEVLRDLFVGKGQIGAIFFTIPASQNIVMNIRGSSSGSQIPIRLNLILQTGRNILLVQEHSMPVE
jgi:hypothetical protein